MGHVDAGGCLVCLVAFLVGRRGFTGLFIAELVIFPCVLFILKSPMCLVDGVLVATLNTYFTGICFPLEGFQGTSL